jgi:hypothetical protein
MTRGVGSDLTDDTPIQAGWMEQMGVGTNRTCGRGNLFTPNQTKAG